MGCVAKGARGSGQEAAREPRARAGSEMLRAPRATRASEAAIKASRLFFCELCDRVRRPQLAKPRKLPTVDEFYAVAGLDAFSEKGAKQAEWQFPNIPRPGRPFHVARLLGDVHEMPSSATVLETH